MKKAKHTFIFFTKQKFSYLENENYQILENPEILFQQIENEVKKRDQQRKLCSFISGGIILLALLVLSFFINYTEKLDQIHLGMGWVFIAAIFLWVLLYYILGFFFYPAIHFEFHFKNLKSQIPNQCHPYANSNYKIFVEKYASFLGNVDFYIPDKKHPERKRKNTLVGFLLIEPKKRNFIFNGKVACNLPYYTLSFQGSKKICFFPSFALYIHGRQTKIIRYEDLKVTIENSDNLAIQNRKVYLAAPNCNITFYINSSFNQNFFNFKF